MANLSSIISSPVSTTTMGLNVVENSLFNDLLTLKLLSLELPDPERCLYPQPSFFTLFPKLPIELRLGVWRVCLSLPKPRVVDIGPPDDNYGYPKWKRRGWHSPRPCKVKKLPVAMWVNSESRTDALRHYCVFPLQPLEWYLEETTIERALYFNPNHDIVCLNYSHIFPFCFPYTCGLRLKDHLPILNEHVSQPLAKIHHLRINECMARSQPSFEILFGFEIAAEDLEAQQKFWMECLFYFPSLQRITLSFYCWSNYESIMEPMTKFLEANREKLVSGKAPKVVFTNEK